VKPGALIVGGNPAAIQAALDLARSGIAVTLLEPSPFLYRPDPGDLVPEPSPHAMEHIRRLEAVKHPNVTLVTGAQVTGVHGRKGRFQVDIERTPRLVDMTRCTACGDCLEVCPVTVSVDGSTRKAIFGGEPGCVPTVFAIEKRGVAPCKATCPGGIHVQGYVALIAEGRHREALDLIREAVPFPGVLGRVCYHPCEDACRRGTEVDAPVSICALKRFAADYEVAHDAAAMPEPVEFDPGLGKVAIVGAGPAGLTVAYFLGRAGVSCEVFEALPVAGGMLAVGIPDYRLPPAVLQREIDAIRALGIPVHLSHPVDDAEWDRLQQSYDAIFVGVGAHRPRRLHLPGEELEGVIPGVSLLRQVNLASCQDDGPGQPPVVGERVIVIGGGNTAIDSAMVARRLGAEKVSVFYRRSRPEMLANPWEIEEAEEEGVEFEYLVSPIRICGDKDGRVVGLECIRNELGEPDQSGRRRPVPVEGSEFTTPCDAVLVAIGQGVSGSFEGVSVTPWGSLSVDPVTLQTSLENVFAGGDAVIGPASVVESIGDGRRAVESILRYLRGEDLAEGRTAERPDIANIPYYTPAQPAARARASMPHITESARRGFAEVALGLSEEQAIAEAQRCLSCGVCSECLACVQVCQPNAIDHQQGAVQETLEASVVIWSDVAGPLPPLTRGNLYELYGDDPLVASAVAARAMADLALYREKRALPRWKAPPVDVRMGVFVCLCGDRITEVVDTGRLVAASRTRPGVVHAQEVPFACQPEGAATIRRVMAEQNLSQMVLAACSCCSLDQVCESCTYQRIRCKNNLLDLPDGLAGLPAEFVNIREQCAWAHRDDPERATEKARRLIAAAIAKTHLLHPTLRAPRQMMDLEVRILVLGEGEAGDLCASALRAQNFSVTRSTGPRAEIKGSFGSFVVAQEDVNLQATVIVLAPTDEKEQEPPIARPGLFVCPPDGDPELIGLAVAGRVGAFLGSGRIAASQHLALVDPARCRACGTCETVCEHEAINVGQVDDRLLALVEPLLCQGCGTCVGRCPSGAISAGYSTDDQIGAMLEALLASDPM
jgi:NADPH-dependent glutamate synthase beta subunit-like oxidoreductase/NAD-dependent dihydropyrimidine dehydrogenase PreA subunit